MLAITKKGIVALAVICVLLALAPLQAFGSEEGVEGEGLSSRNAIQLEAVSGDQLIAQSNDPSDFDYEIKTGEYGYGAYIKKYQGTSEYVVVPRQLGGVDVLYFDVNYVDVTNVDVSQCVALKHLDVFNDRWQGSRLAYLRLGDITELQHLRCSFSYLSSLDVSNLPELQVLWLNGTGVSSLDVSNNPKLRELQMSMTPITSIDLRNNPLLEEFGCINSRLDSINLSTQVNLTELLCNGNSDAFYSRLDLTNNSKLETLDISGYSLPGINLRNNPELKMIVCNESELASLDVSHLGKLEYLYCRKSNLQVLDVSNNPLLKELGCNDNQLSALDVTHNPLLVDLNCANNSISVLDVSRCSGLEELLCQNNKLTSLDISGNPALTKLYCSNNEIFDTIALHAWLKQSDHEGGVSPQRVTEKKPTPTEPTPVTQSSYADVPADHWAISYIERAKELGFMTGHGTGETFRPDYSITRAEVVTALWKAAGQPNADTPSGFTDLADSWNFTSIAWAVENGIATGYEDYPGSNTYSCFKPNDSVTREEFATFLARFAQHKGANATPVDASLFESMPDKNVVSSFARTHLQWCMENKIITGLNGTISPKGSATRAEVATMMVRAELFIK